MKYQPKNFQHLLGTEGFSDKLLKNHFTLYEGYVKNTNALIEELRHLGEQGKESTPAFAEIKRRFGWEFNGMRLHEYYFGGLKKDGSHYADSDLAKKIAEDFGSAAVWEKDFRATAAMRGIGWVVLYLDPGADRLFNVWINEHDLGHLAGASVLLVLDVFEHAYMPDYGLERKGYIQAYFEALDWEEISHRYALAAQKAVSYK